MRFLKNLILNQIRRSYSETTEFTNINREKTLNEVRLVGRVGQDPKVTQYDPLNESKKVITFSLATTEYAGTDPNTKESTYRTDWHRISVFTPHIQERVINYVRKGNRLLVSGRIRYDFIEDKNGIQRNITAIVANDIIFMHK